MQIAINVQKKDAQNVPKDITKQVTQTPKKLQQILAQSVLLAIIVMDTTR
jgi:hypothetical protein